MMRISLFLLTLLLIACGDNGGGNSATADNGRACTTAATTSHREAIAQSLVMDIDGDGVINVYDALPFDSNKTVVGNGTEENPFMIYNAYQLTAYIGYDHTGAQLAESNYTNKSYLYSAGSFYQVVE